MSPPSTVMLVFVLDGLGGAPSPPGAPAGCFVLIVKVLQSPVMPVVLFAAFHSASRYGRLVAFKPSFDFAESGSSRQSCLGRATASATVLAVNPRATHTLNKALLGLDLVQEYPKLNGPLDVGAAEGVLEG